MLAPDLRGFGYSSHTDDFKSSHTMGDLVHDLTCILEHAGAQSAICMGFVFFALGLTYINGKTSPGMIGDRKYVMKLHVCDRIFSLQLLVSLSR